MKFANQAIVITGAGGGIGRASALEFSRQGGMVIVSDIDERGAKETVEMIRSEGGVAEYVYTDVSDFQSVEACIKACVDQFGKIDVLFNNAGMNIDQPLIDFDPKVYEKIIQVNQHGVFYGILAASRKMKELGTPGVIINTASVYAYLATEASFAYTASKAAVIMMTKAAALDLAPYGIRVVSVSPGFVETKLIEEYRHSPELWKFLSEDPHMRRKIIKPEEIAKVVTFLATPEASVINGSDIMADDGFASFKQRF
jgi:glucose 1-dehydrogenase